MNNVKMLPLAMAVVASLRFTIQPFFWQRIEFQLLILLGGGLVLWLVVQFRLHTLRRNEARLTPLGDGKNHRLAGASHGVW